MIGKKKVKSLNDVKTRMADDVRKLNGGRKLTAQEINEIDQAAEETFTEGGD